jgi:uncharacterized protein YlxW (UPF0749 family)
LIVLLFKFVLKQLELDRIKIAERVYKALTTFIIIQFVICSALTILLSFLHPILGIIPLMFTGVELIQYLDSLTLLISDYRTKIKQYKNDMEISDKDIENCKDIINIYEKDTNNLNQQIFDLQNKLDEYEAKLAEYEN